MLLLVLSILFSIISTVFYFSDVYFSASPIKSYSEATEGNPLGGIYLINEGAGNSETTSGVNNGK